MDATGRLHRPVSTAELGVCVRDRALLRGERLLARTQPFADNVALGKGRDRRRAKTRVALWRTEEWRVGDRGQLACLRVVDIPAAEWRRRQRPATMQRHLGPAVRVDGGQARHKAACGILAYVAAGDGEARQALLRVRRRAAAALPLAA